MAGYRIRYARTITGGERHPITYNALRRRTAKWAFGCTQVMLRWGGSVLLSRHLSAAEKATFFLTVNYYHFQALTLLYLVIFYAVLPFHDERMGGAVALLFSAGLILLLTFLPSATYFLRSGRFLSWPKAVAWWGFTYGSQDFVILTAIFRCLAGKSMVWVPTNAIPGIQLRRLFGAEFCFGLLIVSVVAVKHPSVLLLPTTVLFAGKFLITPWLHCWFLTSPVRSAGASELGSAPKAEIPSHTQ